MPKSKKAKKEKSKVRLKYPKPIRQKEKSRQEDHRRVVIYLRKDQITKIAKERIRRFAEEDKVDDRSEIIREAIDFYFSHKKK